MVTSETVVCSGVCVVERNSLNMAGTLCSFVVAVVLLLAISTKVGAERGLCTYMDRCTDQFQDAARNIGHDQETYCQLMQTRVSCYHRVIRNCPSYQRQFAESQIQNAQAKMTQACGAISLLSSVVVLTLGTSVAVLCARFL